jgi:alpha-tubulin suppressor-like RCC1 family protein
LVFDGSTTPVAVTGLSSGVTAIAPNFDFSLAVQNGGVYAWGQNDYGQQLGTGTPMAAPYPVAVASLSSGVTAVSGGFDFSLAIQNGGAYAWGSSLGGLGNGTTSSGTPVAVSRLSNGVTAIAAGNNFSLAVQNGGVYAWGANGDGQLGNGTTTSSATPVAVTTLSSGVTAVAADAYHAVAIQDGGVWAWGLNSSGQLGNGTTTNSSTPVAVTGLSSGVTAIATGYAFCLAVKNGGVYTWGNGYEGDLGNGGEGNEDTPTQIDSTQLDNIIEVAAGDDSGYALSSDGSLWVWGDDDDGQLGVGTDTANNLKPQQLLPPAGYEFTSVAAYFDGETVEATLQAVPEPMSLGLILLPALLLRRTRCSLP